MDKSVISILKEYADNKKLPLNLPRDIRNCDEICEAFRAEVDYFFAEGLKIGLRLGLECKD